MTPEWEKTIWVNATRTEHGSAKLSINMGLTGPMLILHIGDERLVIATRWQSYVSDAGSKQLIDLINEGMEQLKNRQER